MEPGVSKNTNFRDVPRIIQGLSQSPGLRSKSGYDACNCSCIGRLFHMSWRRPGRPNPSELSVGEKIACPRALAAPKANLDISADVMTHRHHVQVKCGDKTVLAAWAGGRQLRDTGFKP
jgi:hypothetical protein